MKIEIDGIILFLVVVLIMELFAGAGVETFIIGCVFIFIVNTLGLFVGLITRKGGD